MGTEAYSITSTFIVHNEPLTAGIMLSVNTPGRHGSKIQETYIGDNVLIQLWRGKIFRNCHCRQNNPPIKHKKTMNMYGGNMRRACFFI